MSKKCRFRRIVRRMAGVRVPAAAAALLVLAFSSPGAVPQPPEAAFSEEFSGTSLDRSRWNVIVTGRTFNNEQQAYVDSTEVLSVADGTLAIQPRYRPG